MNMVISERFGLVCKKSKISLGKPIFLPPFVIKKLTGEKDFKCTACGLSIDRDVNGARNILIKALTAR